MAARQGQGGASEEARGRTGGQASEEAPQAREEAADEGHVRRARGPRDKAHQQETPRGITESRKRNRESNCKHRRERSCNHNHNLNRNRSINQ